MLEQIPFPDQFFDVVYASHILEHTTDIAQALAEIRRVMKDNGYLIFAVPTDFADDGPAHIHRRDKSGWIEDLTANGFVIEESGQFDFNLNEFYGRAVKRGHPSRKEREGDARSVAHRQDIEFLRRELDAKQQELLLARQRLQAIETSTTWRMGQKLARTWPGRALHYLASRLRR